MKININDKNIIIFIPKEIIDFDYKNQKEIEMYLKDKIVKLKRKYFKTISGFYNAKVYQNDYFGIIIEMIHESDIDFFKDLIDIKVNMYYDSEIYFKIEDFFLIKNKKTIYYYDNNYYINVKELTEKDKIILSDFGTYIFGKNLNNIKKQFKVLN